MSSFIRRPADRDRGRTCVRGLAGTLAAVGLAAFVPFTGLALFGPGASSAVAQQETAGSDFDDAALEVQRRLDRALADLDGLYDDIAEERVPLSKELSELEDQLLEARLEFQRVRRILDSRSLDLNNLTNEIEARENETSYLSNLLREYLRNFETRLHIAEMARYADELEQARTAPENDTLSEEARFAAQASALGASLDRLFDALGGSRFDGSAVEDGGLVKPGTFVVLGPVAVFRSSDGEEVGTVEQRINSSEPAVVRFEDPLDVAAAEEVVTANAGGLLPIDPTLGNAHKVESIEETFVEHVAKGGPVMIPIGVLAGLALLVALWRAVILFRPLRPRSSRVNEMLAAVARGERDGALAQARELRGPAGRMLVTGVEHLDEPRELIEEVMYEKVLNARLWLTRMLPFVAICAAAAPLLGLLGTVTGIINTFKLITLFGSGDVKTLSGGISEALITTKFGLITAIPALLLHALLARRSRSIIDDMEKCGIAFVNEVLRTRARRERASLAAATSPSAAAPSADGPRAPEPALAGAGASSPGYGHPTGAGYPASPGYPSSASYPPDAGDGR